MYLINFKDRYWNGLNFLVNVDEENEPGEWEDWEKKIVNKNPILAIRAYHQDFRVLEKEGFSKLGHWRRVECYRGGKTPVRTKLEVWFKNIELLKDCSDWYDGSTIKTFKALDKTQISACCGAFITSEFDAKHYPKDYYFKGFDRARGLSPESRAGFFVEVKGEDYRKDLESCGWIPILTMNTHRIWWLAPKYNGRTSKFIHTSIPVDRHGYIKGSKVNG